MNQKFTPDPELGIAFFEALFLYNISYKSYIYIIFHAFA